MYRTLFLLTLLLILQCPAHSAERQKTGETTFPLVTGHFVSSIVIDSTDARVVQLASGMFANDVFQVTGKKPAVEVSVKSLPQVCIIAGTIGKNSRLDRLIAEKKIDVSAIKGKWESYNIRVLNAPFKGVQKALLVIGSDRRATAYGILELSRMIGISPWEWWADVTPAKRKEINLAVENKVYGSPSVKYRGIFINDEDWGIQPWAAKTFEPKTGDIGPKTYAKVFQLLLRLRANTIWPAMHSCTRPFFSIPENKKVADDYAIVVGTSHCEPMLCNINSEWNDKTMGEWRYDTNSKRIKQLFEKRAKENASYENIYTMGMRGESDSPMNAGNLGMDGQVRLLEKVIHDQRNILRQTTGKSPDKVPQVFIPYKEVLTYYQHGMKLPGDITLVWTDDNYGYIRKLSNPEEQKRPGGAGIYYHASYWGRPHDYLWISSTNPALIWEEMSKAYEFQSHNLWILNCGDIKPIEYNIELFLDMAWNMKNFPNSQSVKTHMVHWAMREFGDSLAAPVTNLMEEYNHLAYMRRPEFMAWSQTEPVTTSGPTGLTEINYGDEITRRIDAYKKLSAQAKKLYAEVNPLRKDAFYELVYYPVTGAANMNLKWLYHYKNQFAARQGRESAVYFARQSKLAYRHIQQETEYFNKQLHHGKWDHMMDMAPRNLPVFSLPVYTVSDENPKTGIGLALEGYDKELNHLIINNFADVLPVFNAYLRDSSFVDVFLKGKGTMKWKAVPRVPWIHLSRSGGTVSSSEGKPEQRVWVSIDWSQVPKGKNEKEAPLGNDYQLIPPSYKVRSAIDFMFADSTVRVGVSVFNPEFNALKNYQGFIEGDGYVSIDAKNYSRKTSGKEAAWQVIDGLGYAGKVMTALPRTAASQVQPGDILQNSPMLEYDFYTFNHGKVSIDVQAVPTHAFYKGRGVRCAVAIDNARPVILDFETFGRSREWKQNVLKNAAVKTAEQEISQPGKHTLKLWMVDPGVMIDQILIDLGGWKKSYAFPPQTIKQ